MVDELKQSAKERLDSSIIGTFTFSLLVLNWEILVYLFSSMETKKKIEEVKWIMFSQEQFLHILFALLFTLFMLFAVPWLKNKYEIYMEKGSLQKLIEKDKVSRMRLLQALTDCTLASEVLVSINTLNSMMDEIAKFQIEIESQKKRSSTEETKAYFIKVSDEFVTKVAEQRAQAHNYITRFHDNIHPLISKEWAEANKKLKALNP